SVKKKKRLAEDQKGHFAVYIGFERKEVVCIPVSHLNDWLFQEFIFQAKEEYGFENPIREYGCFYFVPHLLRDHMKAGDMRIRGKAL
ncbi:indole-3-acetic acid-induced protein arg7, partial [Phtheirospermum japonicum]